MTATPLSRGRRLAAVAACSLLAVATASAVAQPVSAAPAAAPLTAASSASTLEQQEFQLLDLVNRERAAHGLKPLAMQPRLREYARKHAADQRDRGTIWHDMAEYQQWAPSGWSGLGENVAYNSSVAGIHQAYMGSTGHRNNILDPGWTHIGIGLATTSGGRLFNSQNFMTHRDANLPTVGPGSAPPPPSSADTSAPTRPGALSVARPGGGRAVLSWDAATDDRGVTGYRVTVDGAPVATVTGTTSTVTGLARGRHVFVVRAVDAAGNVGPAARLSRWVP